MHMEQGVSYHRKAHHLMHYHIKSCILLSSKIMLHGQSLSVDFPSNYYYYYIINIHKQYVNSEILGSPYFFVYKVYSKSYGEHGQHHFELCDDLFYNIANSCKYFQKLLTFPGELLAEILPKLSVFSFVFAVLTTVLFHAKCVVLIAYNT